MFKEDNFLPFDSTDVHFKQLFDIACVNSDAVFLSDEIDINIRKTKGDATESGIIKFLESVKLISEVRTIHKKVFNVPFNSTNKWMASIVRKPNNGKNLTLFVKGAPERVLTMCTSYYHQTKKIPIDNISR